MCELDERLVLVLKHAWTHACPSFTPFLVINPVVDHAPGQRDAEEHGMTNHLLPWGELVSLIESGDLMPPSVVTACSACGWGAAGVVAHVERG